MTEDEEAEEDRQRDQQREADQSAEPRERVPVARIDIDGATERRAAAPPRVTEPRMSCWMATAMNAPDGAEQQGTPEARGCTVDESCTSWNVWTSFDVAVLLERDLREQREHERERHDDDRDDLDQLCGVRAIELERRRQDVTEAALRDRTAASGARWGWWRRSRTTVVETRHNPTLLWAARTAGYYAAGGPAWGRVCQRPQAGTRSQSAGRTGSSQAGSGRQVDQSSSKGGSRSNTCSTARSPQ